MSIREHGSELARIVVSASSEGRQHLENFMGCTVCVVNVRHYQIGRLIDRLPHEYQQLMLLRVNILAASPLKNVFANFQRILK